MGLCYTTTRWLDRLWGEHLELSAAARELVQEGIAKQGEPFAGFPADLHARLYLPTDPASTDSPPEWAAHLHALATELGEWQRLRLMCARNGFAAGIAAEALLEQLVPHVPERPPTALNPTPSTAAPDDDPNLTRADASDTHLRAALRRAIRAARTAVQQSEAELEGLATPLGLAVPGTATARHAGPADLRAVREAHARLAASPRLRRVAELAGRLERLAVQKARSKVNPGVGELHGVGLGGLPDLARLLPSELVGLRRRSLRLHLLARVLEARALVYRMQGREPQARGPIVVLLDESGSMREADKDIWSKAVALALLATATRQRRAWHLVAFNGAISRELELPPGQATAADLQQALDHRCAGGTDFDAPVLRAIDIIRSSPTMRQADVVVVTDGEDELEPATIASARELTRTEGVSWFVLGVGPTPAHTLAPIATTLLHVLDTGEPEPVLPVLSLDR